MAGELSRDTDAAAVTTEAASAAECLALVAGYHGIAADAEALRHEWLDGGRCTLTARVVRAARAIGLRARLVGADWQRLGRLPLPALARRRDGRFGVIARANTDGVLWLVPGEPAQTLDAAGLDQAWDGSLVLLTRRLGIIGDRRRFGFGWFVPALWKYRRVMGEVLIASVFVQLFALVTPLFFQVVIDKVLVHRGMTTLDVLVFGLLAIAAFDALLGTLRSYLSSHTASRVDVELGAGVFAHLTRLPLAYFQVRPTGHTVARVRELENIREFLTGSFLTVSVDAVFGIAFLAVLWLYSPALTLVVAAALPLYALISIAVTPALRRRTEERFEQGAASQALLFESVSGMETLKSMAVEPVLRHRYESHLAGYVRAAFRARVLGAGTTQAVTLVSRVVTALVLWLGARAVVAGELTVGQLVAFNMIAGQLNAPVLRLAQLWQQLQQARISVARVGDVLNAPCEPVRTTGASLPRLAGAVRFERVTFRYGADSPLVLDELDLCIPAGQLLGVVGRSGSGKSTLARLLQRLYLPERGRVLVDGVDLAMVDPAWLRRQTGVVPQENVLFAGSVRENIALADPSMPFPRVVEAARLAGAHDFILQLPQGYDTELGERGARLSGGQRQRIAIARALAPAPRILVLDEATSALDYESERAVSANLERIRRGRTVVIIAHRLSTVRRCDRIVTLEGGRLVEDGSHDSLLRTGGHYARLHFQQVG